MSKFRVSILIIGMLVIVVAASLLTVFGLYLTGAVVTERTELVFAVFDEEKVYDGTPLFPAKYELVTGELQKGHHAEVNFSGSQTDAGESKSDLSIKICDEKGFDVTSEYKIGVNGGLLKVNPKNISVTLNDEEVIYNGTKVSFENYTVTEGELVIGHKIAGSQNVQLITVNDTLPTDLNAVVFDAVGKDVTKNYNVNFTIGEIRVLPRPVTVKPLDKIKVYDGVELNLNEVEILSGSLADGQYFKEIEINLGDTRFIDVCEEVTAITNIAIYQKVGSAEINVTENYDIDTSETGVVRIDKRSLTITAKSRSWDYDGFDHSLTNDTEPLSCEGLAPGEQLVSITYSGSIKNAGETINTIDIKNIRLLDTATLQSASLDNYEITIVSGTLTVLKRKISIVTPTISKIYDGEPLKGASEEDEPQGINLATNHKIYYDEDSLLSITEHGTIRNQIACKIVDEFDETNTDLSDNYEITYYYGEISVTKRTVRITTPSYSKEFDGVTLYGFEYKDEIDIDNLVIGHDIVVPAGDDIPGITNATRILNKFKVTVNDNKGLDVTDNYNIDYTYGYLEITRLNITVKTGSGTREYNGEPIQRDESYTVFGYVPEALKTELVGGYPSITDASRVDNVVTYKLTKDGVDVDQRNYMFVYTYGYLEITRLTITVKTGSETREYNGETLQKDEDFTKFGYVPEALKAELVGEYPSITDVSRVDNVVTYKLTKDGVDVDENNYIFDYTYGYLEITRLTITVKTGSETREYNGETLQKDGDYTEFSYVPEALETELVGEYPSITDASKVDNVVTYKLTKDGVDVDESNYIFDYTYGYLEITPCNINLYLKDYELVYNDTEFIPETEDALNGNTLPEFLTVDDFILVSLYDEIKNAGSYTYKATLAEVYDLSNFSIKISGGAIEISKCEVIVTLADYYYEYNGEAWDAGVEEAILSVNSLDGEEITHLEKNEFSLVKNAIIKSAGYYTYSAKFVDVSYNRNYTLYVNDGSINIDKHPITIKLPENDMKVYNGKSYLPTSDIMEVDDGLPNSLTTADFKIVAESGDFINANVNPYYYTVQMINSREAENYEITVNRGSLIIEPCPILITLADYNKPYKGEAYKPELVDAIVSCDDTSLVTNINLDQYFELTITGTFKDVGVYYYGIKFIYKEDVSNFDLTIGNESGEGRFLIYKLAVQLEGGVADYTKTFDGTGVTIDTSSAVKNELLRIRTDRGEVIDYISRFTVKCSNDEYFVGTHSLNYTDLCIYNGFGEDITRNFEINIVATGNLIINRREITFVLDDYTGSADSNLYNGCPEFVECLRVASSTPLLSGYFIKFDAEIINYNRSQNTLAVNEFDEIHIFSEKGEDVTDNFMVTNENRLTSSVIIRNS